MPIDLQTHTIITTKRDRATYGISAIAIVLCMSLATVSCGRSTNKVITESPTPSSQGRFISVPWKLIGVEEDRLLKFVALEGGCVTFDHMEANESKGEKIIVTAIAKDDTPPKGADPRAGSCSGALQHEFSSYELDKPLGSRELVHAPISPEWGEPTTVEGEF